MNNERDMYYGTYGYGYMPMAGMTGNIPTNQMKPDINYQQNNLNDLTERINRLERQIKRLDQRLTRIETPYSNNEPDNNMYIM